jgi:hypothetical protein
MPFSCDPDATFDLVLKIDQGKPAEQRPTFQCRYLSCREEAKVDRLWKEAFDDATPIDAFYAKLQEAAWIIVAGWRNWTDRVGRPIPYAADSLMELGNSDLQELIQSSMKEQRLSEAQKKGSRSPSASPTGTSAPTAPTPSA